jgi:aryl sulfotransferase
LDALPYREDVSYVYCGRDPRDVFLSMQNHMGNINMEKFGQAMAAQGIEAAPPPPMPEDVNERFRLWMQNGTYEWEQDGLPFWSHFRHAQTYWKFRDLGNIHFLHYADLKADLERQMRRLAGLLGITVPDDKWPELVKAATFEDMQANADRTAPDTNFDLWLSNKSFFNKGENRQWEGVLSDENLQIYEDTFRQRYGTQIVEWLERGSLKVGYPGIVNP